MIYKTVILAARSSPNGQTHNKSLKQVFLHMCVRWGEAGWLKVGIHGIQDTRQKAKIYKVKYLIWENICM